MIIFSVCLCLCVFTWSYYGCHLLSLRPPQFSISLRVKLITWAKFCLPIRSHFVVLVEHEYCGGVRGWCGGSILLSKLAICPSLLLIWWLNLFLNSKSGKVLLLIPGFQQLSYLTYLCSTWRNSWTSFYSNCQFSEALPRHWVYCVKNLNSLFMEKLTGLLASFPNFFFNSVKYKEW